MNVLIKITLLVVLLVLVFHQIISNTSTEKTEIPEYKILKKLNHIEIREYPALIMATTNLGSSYGENSGNGFRTVANYIFGGNETNEKISMTAPVVVEMSDTMKMSFIMPSQYKMEELPKPNNSNVNIHKEQEKIVAVIQYPGFSNDKKMEEYRLRLEQELKENNLSSKGSFMYFGYNPPYQLTNRRNEIAVEIEW